MKDNDLLMIVLAFFLGFCFRKMMGGRLVEGTEDTQDTEGKKINLTHYNRNGDITICDAVAAIKREDNGWILYDDYQACSYKYGGNCIPLYRKIDGPNVCSNRSNTSCMRFLDYDANHLPIYYTSGPDPVSYSCIPDDITYRVKLKDKKGNLYCPEGYEETSDTGYTTKKQLSWTEKTPPGCKDDCGFGGCWFNTKCTNIQHYIDVKDKTGIQLCKKKNTDRYTTKSFDYKPH